MNIIAAERDFNVATSLRIMKIYGEKNDYEVKLTLHRIAQECSPQIQLWRRIVTTQ